MAEELADKTEAPTLHRRAEARNDGKLAISGELSAAVLCLCAAVLLRQTGPGVLGALRTLLVEGLSATPTSAGHIGALLLRALAPIAIGLLLVGIAVNVGQTKFWFGWRKETGVLDVGAGIQRIFSTRAGFGLLMNVIKLVIVALIAWTTIRARMESIVTLQSRPIEDMLPAAMSIVFAVAFRVCAALIVLGVIDYVYQRRRLENEMRMTRREVRDELRRQEGDPETKRRRRDLWRMRRKV